MNNNYYRLIKRIEEVAKQNVIVESVIYAKTEDKDLFKNTKFPLIHINPTQSTFLNEKVTQISFEIGVFTIRDASKVRQDIGFEGQDNVIDNHNTTYAILNELLTTLRKDNRDGIRMMDNIALTPIFLADKNGLDGWMATITFQMPSFLNVTENMNRN